jgi:hypothetical protein
MGRKDRASIDPSQKSQVLSDHKKVGSRFIPPWLQFAPMREVKYVGLVLPELIWLAVLNDFHGLRKGAELALTLSKAMVAASGDSSRKKLYALTSSYTSITNEEKRRALNSLRLSNQLKELQQALAPFVTLYPECPLNFLLEEKIPPTANTETLLPQFKQLLSTLFDKYEKPATLMQANAIYIAFVTDLLRVKAGLALANFPAVADFPETEESKRVAASVYSAVNGVIGNFLDQPQLIWPNYFWSNGLAIESCNYKEIYDAYEH